jgi:hypothetical protein
MSIKLHGKIVGKFDQIRIYYHIGAILFRYSIIEEWVVNTFAQRVFGNGDVKQFTNKFRSLSFGSKLPYLRGEDIIRGDEPFFVHTEQSLAILDIHQQCSDYQRLSEELIRICTERNQFIHTAYFVGSSVEDWKIKFSSWRPKKRDGQFVNEDITPTSIRKKYKAVMADWKLVQKLQMELSVCFVRKIQELETLSK